MTEQARISFMINRDGLEEAKAWALRTMRIYRTAVLCNGKDGGSIHYGSNPVYRPRYIRAYLELKRFVYDR